MESLVIRKGKKEDIPQVFNLVKELSIFEKAEEKVANTIERMEMEGFGDNPAFKFFVAEVNGQIVGMALYYFSYSTWKGRSLYIDDLIVTEAFRKKGIGDQLFQKVFEVAKKEKCGKIHWQVLDWNTPAINYYKKLGAEFEGEWINCAITSDKY